jgi:hypothetical protein
VSVPSPIYIRGIHDFFSTNFVIFYQKICNFNVNSTNFPNFFGKNQKIVIKTGSYTFYNLSLNCIFITTG